MDPRDEDVEIERLRQVVVSARGKPAEHVLWRASRGEHQHRDELAALPQLGRHGKAVDPRQHDVEHDSVDRRLLRQSGERGLARLHDLGEMALRLEVEPQPIGQVPFVLHDQNPAHTSGAIGSESVNVLPWPGPPLSATTRPPCLRATERTMNSPSPVPLTRVAAMPGMR